MPSSANGRKQASNQQRAAAAAENANETSPSASPPAGNAAASSSSIPVPELRERGNSVSARGSISNGEGQDQQMNVVHNQQDPVASWCWQNGKSSVYERLAYLYNNTVLSDVLFVVGKGAAEERVPAHKFVLSMGSPVFDAMFNGNLATLDTEIHIPDIEPAAFSALLKFLYTDDFGDISHYSVMTTLYAAKKYSVPALQMACVEFLKRNLRADNAFLLVAQARLFDETELAALCMETIDQNTSEAINAEGSGFLELDHETLCAVLERDTLHIREIKLFIAIDKWAEQECIRQGKPTIPGRKREVLGAALELIRFPVMTIEEFANVPARNGLLTDTEVKDLFLYFTLNPKPETRFLEIPRSCVVGKEYTVTRFQQTDNRWGYSGTADRIRFSVDRQVYVVGLGLYGSVHGPADYLVTLQIILSSNQKVVAQHDTNFSSDGSESIFRVNFKKPVEIQPNIHYTISSCLKGPDSFYGTRGIRKVVKQTSTQSPVVFNFIYSPGYNNGTSVEDGQIPEIVFLIP